MSQTLKSNKAVFWAVVLSTICAVTARAEQPKFTTLFNLQDFVAIDGIQAPETSISIPHPGKLSNNCGIALRSNFAGVRPEDLKSALIIELIYGTAGDIGQIENGRLVARAKQGGYVELFKIKTKAGTTIAPAIDQARLSDGRKAEVIVEILSCQ